MRANVSYGKMKGSSADVKDYYPNLAGKPPYEFNNTLIDVGFTYEYNFWPYGTGRDYRGAQPITPFVFAGLGATYVSLDGQTDKSSVFRPMCRWVLVSNTRLARESISEWNGPYTFR